MDIRKVITLVKKELFSTLANPKERFVIFVPMVLQLILFSYVAIIELRNVSIGIISNDNGSCYTAINDGIMGAGQLFANVRYFNNLEEAKEVLNKQSIVGYINVPSDFSRNIFANQSAQIQTIYDGRKLNSAITLSFYLNSIIGKAVLECDKFNKKNNYVNGVVNIRNWFNSGLNFKWYMGPAILIVVICMSSFEMAAMSIAKEKEFGTFDQLIVSPVTKLEIAMGKMFSIVALSLIQGSIMFLIIIGILQIPFRGNLILIFLAVFLSAANMIAIGLFISNKCKTQQQANLLSFFVNIQLTTTCGFSVAFENMPIILQKISYLINPMCHGLFISRGVFLKDLSFFEVWPHIFQMLVIFTVFVFLILRSLEKDSD